MAVRVWFEQDIQNALSAVALASKLLPNPISGEDMAYLRGFRAALEVVSASFGVPVQELETSLHRPSLLPDLTSRTQYTEAGSGD